MLYELPGWPRVIRGRADLMAAFAGYGDAIKLRAADALITHRTDDGRVVVIEYEVHGTILATGVTYDNRFCSIIAIEAEDRSLARLHGLAGLRGRADPQALKQPPAPRPARGLHAMYCPPLAVSVEPAMKPASSEARNSTQRAISSGSPRRRTGICGRIAFSNTSFGTAITISVAM